MDREKADMNVQVSTQGFQNWFQNAKWARFGRRFVRLNVKGHGGFQKEWQRALVYVSTVCISEDVKRKEQVRNIYTQWTSEAQLGK